jgi:hypothetical protein
MNDELVRIWKEAGRGLIEVHMPGGAEENLKRFRQRPSSIWVKDVTATLARSVMKPRKSVS